MKYIIWGFLVLLMTSCSQNTINPTTKQSCFSISVGDKWVYNVSDKNGQYIETHLVKEIVQKEIDNLTFSAYVINASAPLHEDYTWYMLTKDDTLLIGPTIKLQPIFNDIFFNTNANLWFKFNFCPGDSFTTQATTYENVMLIHNDSLVEAKISLSNSVNFKLPISDDYSVNSKEIQIDKYEYDYHYQEQLIEPANAIFDNGTRSRNVFSFRCEIWFSNEIGFLKMVNQVFSKQLIEFEKGK